jgi:hypothetical protein
LKLEVDALISEAVAVQQQKQHQQQQETLHLFSLYGVNNQCT